MRGDLEEHRPRRGSARPGLSIESLLWTTSLFCGFAGAFLLVAPHHFQSQPYEALLPFGIVWGTLALAAGVGLLSVAVLRPRRQWLSFCGHALAGVTLLTLAASFLRVGALTGTIAYTILGLGTIVAGLRPRGAGAGDLFGLLMGLLATILGFLMVAAPHLFRSILYGPYRDYVPALGLALLLTGPLLVYAQLSTALKPWQLWLAHILAGASFFAYAAMISLPNRTWTGIALYGGGGVVIALLPWVRSRLSALDTSALRTRLALALVVSTSLGLILATAVATAQEERLAAEQAVATQKIEAGAIAQNVSDYVELNGARAFALAALAGQLPMTPESQGDLLQAARKTYPDVTAVRIVAADGRVIAANGEARLPPGFLRSVVDDLLTRPQPRVQLVPAAAGQHLSLLLWAPIHRGDSLAGLLVAALDSEALEQRIARPGSAVTLANGLGRPIASHSEPLRGERLPRLPAGWDSEIRAGRKVESAGTVAGFAVVPKLDWVVAVERPRADALAGVRQGRDLAFGLLLLVIPLGVVGGIMAARRITRPLGDLSEAVGELTAGNLAAPIGADSGITEVARLSAAFREMRDRLAARTRESERLAAELRARAEALAETDRRKNEFLAMLAHELRNPLGAIANASYLLEQLGGGSPTMERSVAIIRRQIQHLVRLVDDLLDVSRITRGKVELRRGPLDLGEVVRHAVDTTRPLADAKEQRLRLELPAEPLPLDGDGTRLEQVFSNLLRNAIKFTEAGGLIQITAQRDGAAEAVVRVRDDGIGIAPDLLPRIFDLFAQGEQALDRTGAGLGIGLTLVRSLVEMHGGRVEARSDGPGKGTEVEVRLPLAV
ncbi:MAG TPA: sensor histidine kinase [Thermoanaerobaculia bacterium]|nr:sensor histidine kinase [Thermoanaerobaculia bacterium]